jgi:DNA (cytosine-5)-methyltransferase 3A
MHINSALVSAQNRQRFYAFNWEVEQPEDRGVLLRDVLETNTDEQPYELQTVGVGYRNRREDDGRLYRRFETSGKEKANALTTVQTDSMVAEPVRIGTIENNLKNKCHDSKQYRVYSPDGKSTTLCGQGGGVGAKTGLYACPALNEREVNGKRVIAYEVRDGLITIKGKQYPIKLQDGYYIIRKLTVKECCRLQTLPDDYCREVSNSQAYKGLGNGWTAEVIIHILNGALKDVPRDEEIVVLSMYDGIGTGRYCLDKMGFTNVKYFAYEIDKYAKEVALSNYPDIIHCGDAFNLRHPDWTIGY